MSEYKNVMTKSEKICLFILIILSITVPLAYIFDDGLRIFLSSFVLILAGFYLYFIFDSIRIGHFTYIDTFMFTKDQDISREDEPFTFYFFAVGHIIMCVLCVLTAFFLYNDM